MLTGFDRQQGKRISIGRGMAQAIAGAFLLSSSPAVLALGFGELLSQSALNRPLDAVFPIMLDHAGDADAQMPEVNIASEAVYTQMGATKPDLLATATIEMEASGSEVRVHVRTPRSVLEPYVPLIVELRLPSGVLRHRYDLLLDPIVDRPLPQVARTPAPAPAPVLAPAPPVAALPPPPLAATPPAQPEARALPKPPRRPAAAEAPSPPSRAPVRQRVQAPAMPAASAPAPTPPQASPPGPWGLFKLDFALHGPIPAAPVAAPPAAAPPAATAAATAAAAPQAAPQALPAEPPAAQHPPVQAVDSAPASEAAPPSPPVDAAAAPATPPPSSSSHYFLLDLIIIVLLLVGALQALRKGLFDRLLGLRRRGQEEEEVAEHDEYEPAHSPPPEAQPAAPAAPRELPKHSADLAAVPRAKTIDDSLIPFEPVAAPEPPKAGSVRQERYEGIEVIDASGFYDDVALLLEQTLKREPMRLDLYRQLIEVYVAAGKPQLGQRIKKQLEEMRSRPPRGLDNEALQRELEHAESILPQEEAVQPVGGSLTVAAKEPRFLRYYDGPGFESLAEHLAPVRAAYNDFRKDPLLQQSLMELINEEVGRPSPLQPALQISRNLGGAQVYFKREDVRLADSERIINLIGQTMLMRSMGKLSVVTAAASAKGASAMVAAAKALGMPSTVFLTQDQLDHLDPALLKLADKHQVEFLAARDPKDARRDALAYWLAGKERVGYVTGLRAGPDPYPTIVMDFVAVVGHETRRQLLRYGSEDPAVIIGSAFGGFSSIGFVRPYLEKPNVRIIMTDPPAGLTPDADAQPPPGVAGYELALREQRWLYASGRVEYIKVDPEAARRARLDCDRVEEFMPKPGDAAAIGMGLQIAKTLPASASLVVLLSALGPT